jgi:hypothetical protein
MGKVFQDYVLERTRIQAPRLKRGTHSTTQPYSPRNIPYFCTAIPFSIREYLGRVHGQNKDKVELGCPVLVSAYSQSQLPDEGDAACLMPTSLRPLG